MWGSHISVQSPDKQPVAQLRGTLRRRGTRYRCVDWEPPTARDWGWGRLSVGVICLYRGVTAVPDFKIQGVFVTWYVGSTLCFCGLVCLSVLMNSDFWSSLNSHFWAIALKTTTHRASTRALGWKRTTAMQTDWCVGPCGFEIWERQARQGHHFFGSPELSSFAHRFSKCFETKFWCLWAP